MTVADIAISCLNLPKCVAFVIEQQTACGYLKTSATGLRPGGDYVTYCLRSRGAHCAGELHHSLCDKAACFQMPGQVADSVE